MAIWMKIGGISTCVDNGSPIVYGWITNKVEITAFRDGDKIIGTSAMARFIHKESTEFRGVVEATRLSETRFRIVLKSFRIDREIAHTVSEFTVTAPDQAIWTAIQSAVRAL
jgi:hypothetical protein